MSGLSELLNELPEFPLQPAGRDSAFGLTHVPFTGIPYRHKEDSGKIVLAVDVESGDAGFLEFFIEDIDRLEQVETMVAGNGQALPVVRLWVRKGALAFRYTPFLVEDLRGVFRDLLPEPEARQRS